MNDNLKQQIEVLSETFSEERLVEVVVDNFIQCKSCIKVGYRNGAKEMFDLLTKWIPVTESLPEDHPELLKSIPDVKCTIKVLVKTETNSVIEASRVKYALPPDHHYWCWHGGFSDEEIVEWRILY